MAFEWDPSKAESNRRKHEIDFADAVGAFEDPYALTRPDPHPAEERLVALGRDILDRVVMVCWTWSGANIRLISARRATPQERRRNAEDVDA